MLGIVREDRLLPWDNDIDMSIKEQYENKLLSCLKEISSSGYRVGTKEFTKDSRPFEKDRTSIIKVRNNRFFFFRGLDIYIKYKDNKQYFYQCGISKKVTDSSFFDTLDTIVFNSKIYNIPRNHEEYLRKKYANWQMLNKTWNAFIDDSSIIGYLQ